MVAAAAALAQAPGALALTPSEFFARVSPSVWLVRTYDRDGLPIAQGSAVVVAAETLITNCHVLSKASRFEVVHDDVKRPAKLDMWDTVRDLCQVKAYGLAAPAVELGDSSKVVVGQPVFALGSPRGFELTLSDGLVSALRHDGAQRLALIQTSAPISHGSSGGGLFDTEGRLIGITSSGVDAAQNLNFAIPVESIRELPARHLAALQKTPTPPPIVAAATQAAVPSPPPAPPAPAPQTPVATTGPAAPMSPTQTTNTATAALGTTRIPFLNDARQAQFRNYYGDASYPKACAISDNGHFSCTGGTRPKDRNLPNDPKERALRKCAELANKGCVLYVVDDTIVYQAQASAP